MDAIAPKTGLYFDPMHNPDQCPPKCLILLPGPTSGETWARQKSELVCLDLTKNCCASLILGWARFCSLKLDLDWVCVEVWRNNSTWVANFMYLKRDNNKVTLGFISLNGATLTFNPTMVFTLVSAKSPNRMIFKGRHDLKTWMNDVMHMPWFKVWRRNSQWVANFMYL